jgi:hypothetical protein
MGNPSRHVQALGVVPGVFSRIADTDPPKCADPIRLENRIIAVIGSIVNVKGSSNAIPVIGLKPGNAPKIIPSIVPPRIISIPSR